MTAATARPAAGAHGTTARELRPSIAAATVPAIPSTSATAWWTRPAAVCTAGTPGG